MLRKMTSLNQWSSLYFYWFLRCFREIYEKKMAKRLSPRLLMTYLSPLELIHSSWALYKTNFVTFQCISTRFGIQSHGITFLQRLEYKQEQKLVDCVMAVEISFKTIEILDLSSDLWVFNGRSSSGWRYVAKRKLLHVPISQCWLFVSHPRSHSLQVYFLVVKESIC